MEIYEVTGVGPARTRLQRPSVPHVFVGRTPKLLNPPRPAACG